MFTQNKTKLSMKHESSSVITREHFALWTWLMLWAMSNYMKAITKMEFGMHIKRQHGWAKCQPQKYFLLWQIKGTPKSGRNETENKITNNLNITDIGNRYIVSDWNWCIYIIFIYIFDYRECVLCICARFYRCQCRCTK